MTSTIDCLGQKNKILKTRTQKFTSDSEPLEEKITNISEPSDSTNITPEFREKRTQT